MMATHFVAMPNRTLMNPQKSEQTILHTYGLYTLKRLVNMIMSNWKLGIAA